MGECMIRSASLVCVCVWGRACLFLGHHKGQLVVSVSSVLLWDLYFVQICSSSIFHYPNVMKQRQMLIEMVDGLTAGAGRISTEQILI